MRNKIIMITAMVAVMIAMTGIAAATTTTSPADIDIIYVGSNPASVITVKFDTSTMSISDTLGGLEFVFKNKPSLTLTSEVTGSFDGVTYTGNQGTVASYTMEGTWAVWQVYVKDATDVDDATQNGHLYSLKFNVKNTAGTTIESSEDIGLATTVGHAVVPEFPMIALPVAAVLGLVFFFQQKKRKEE